MRVIQFERFGEPSELHLHNFPPPTPGPGEVLIRVEAAAVNPSDVKNVAGLMPHVALPRVPGRDFAGTVVQGPQDLIGLEVWGTGGDLGFERDGTHAELLLLPRSAVAAKPKALSMTQAAAVGVPHVTAWSALERAQVRKGEIVVVTGAAGSVGGSALQILKWRGAVAIAAVRDGRQAEAVQAFDPDGVIDLETERLQDGILPFTQGRGADVVFDTVGGPLFEPSIESLGIQGRLVVITAPGERRAAFDLMAFYRRELSLFGVNTLLLDATDCAKILETLAPGFESGALQPPPIAETYPLPEAARAYERMRDGGLGGKVVLLPGK